MKNKRKDFNKFSKRNTVRDRAKRELLKMVEETNVGFSHAKVKFTEMRPRSEMCGRAKREYAVGIFSETASGFGFVRCEGEDRDIFIPESGIGYAIDGDTVRISFKRYLSEDGRERTEGRIEEVTEYGRSTVIGTVDCDIVRVHKRRVHRFFIISDDGRIGRRIYLNDGAGAMPGDKVQVKLKRSECYSYSLEGEVIANFGESYTKEANYLAVLAECGITTDFTPEELDAAAIAAAEPISCEGRVIRDEVIFTIDSESAKDLDDAISVRRTASGFELGVHIADVSHYVREKTALDRLVMSRGTSVYFTDKVVPMLPEALSNGACSLNPGEDKYTLSAIMEIGKRGEILSVRIEPSVIRSRVKGIYSEINRIFGGEKDSALLEKYKDCLDSLAVMRELYGILKEKSERRGAVELDSDEAEIILDKEGKPIDIVRRRRGESEMMIEQFMLAANEAVATFMLDKGIPCVFRVHEPPAPEKISEFINYLHSLGFDTSFINKDKCESRDLAAVIAEAEKRGISEAVSYACLRSMSKACYSEIPRSHFGLSIEKYCHFTSPIRRLSDLATHRIIHGALLSGKAPEKYKSYAKRAAAAATDGELRAVSAERKIENIYKIIYMSDKIGEVFDASVSSVTSFGAFATLENTCEGLIPLSMLGRDYFYDEKTLSLRSNKDNIRIGDRIKIRVEEADIRRGKLLFSRAEGEK
ncbi:MAG: VacB/RNase II family 3'-5' exoribonuclease [Clostridia bacterium]|nr:VacB/RNase II family 3'-5' exoribonuclease [Clostridia bacterium]